MKLRRKYAWLLTAPLAWMSGCGVGPISGLADREPVVSLEQPDPLAALRRSSAVQSVGADEGAFSTADWQGASDDPEGRRLILLSGARRRIQQKMMMQMMMMPQSVEAMPQQPSTPNYASAPTRSKSSSSKSTSSNKASASPSKTTKSPAAPTVNPIQTPGMMSPEMLTPEALAELITPTRRGFRGSRAARPQDRVDRAENAATTEADRIERAAAAEAERAEKAALAEAQIAERRLLAEAELVERMTRAELELAERLATAKEERDRRIALAREERELRMAILGIDTDDLDTDPVDEALTKLERKQPSRDGESGLTRFTRFFRSKSEEPNTRIASQEPRQSQQQREIERDAIAEVRPRRSESDLVDRTLEHSDSLLNQPSIAEFASSIPSEAPRVAQRDGSDRHSQPEELHSSLLDSWGDEPQVSEDKYDSLLAQDEVFPRDESSNSEDWSLLDGFGDAGSSLADGGSDAAASPPAFPFESAADFSESSVASQESDFARNAPASSDVHDVASSEHRDPTSDLWILDDYREDESSSLLDDWPTVADGSEPRDTYQPESFTQPGGLFAQAESEVEKPSPAPSPSEENGFGLLDNLMVAADDSRAAEAPIDEPSSDPWISDRPELDLAATVPADPPVFDWSQTAEEPVETVVHTQPPAVQAPIRSAAWTSQSLRDVCGQLPEDLEALVLQLDIPEAGVRKAVLADLAALNEKARPALPAIRVLLDDSPLVAAHAAWTLWQIEGNESTAVRELVRLLQTGEPETVQFTAYALGSLGPKARDAAPILRAERERFNGATRVHVAEALTRIDAFDQASVEVLMLGLRHPETHVRWLSALALGDVQVRYADIAVPALVGALQDADPEVRSAACLSIGGFGGAAQSAIPELQSRATLDAPSVREAAQTALACIRK